MFPSIPGYKILNELGSGGMSRVYLAESESVSRKFAIKIIEPTLAEDPGFIARFQREARITHNINDPNIVSVIGQGRIDETYYIIMEYVEGIDLQKAIRKNVPPQEIAMLITQGIAKALSVAHQNSIIHRDIKPANVLLGFRGQVKVVDFGLARDSDSTGAQLTVVGHMMGTPAFMSPEQQAAKGTDHRTDIYSLGATAYDILTGEITIRRRTSSEVAGKLFQWQPPESINPEGIHPRIRKVVKRMMTRRVAGRYQTMEDVLQAIDECLSELPGASDYLARRDDYLARYAKNPEMLCDELRRARGIRVKSRSVGPNSQVTTLMHTPAVRLPVRKRWWSVGMASTAALLIAAAVVAKLFFRTPATPPDKLSANGLEAGTVTGPVDREVEQIPGGAITPRPDTTQAVSGAGEKPPEATGSLFISSTPSGASVLIRRNNLTRRGTTPCRLEELENGKWRVRLQKDGYTPLEREVTIAGNSLRLTETLPVVVPVPPEPKPPEVEPTITGDSTPGVAKPLQKGFLEILVLPYGDIYVNDRRVAQRVRAYRDSVESGAYNIRVVHPTYGMKTVDQRIEPGQSYKIPFAFP